MHISTVSSLKLECYSVLKLHMHSTHTGLASWIVHLVINAVQVNYLKAGNVFLLIGHVSCLLVALLMLIRHYSICLYCDPKYQQMLFLLSEHMPHLRNFW